MGSDENDLLRRVLAQAGDADLLEALTDRLSGADLTSLLLEVMRRRVSRISPAELLRQYRTDRFVAPGSVDFFALRRVEDAMLAVLPAGFEVVPLAPVLPLGAHSAVAGVDPRNVIATIRRTEVAADPTNGLALEAAERRRQLLALTPRSAAPVRLAASQRVTRAQLTEGPGRFAHFRLLGLVTAGRDRGGHEFERDQLLEHLLFAVAGLTAAGAGLIQIALTELDDAAAGVGAAVRAELGGIAGVRVVDAPERASGRVYYRCLCFKVFVTVRGPAEAAGPYGASRLAGGPDRADVELLEIADGGFVDWTARLLGNRKERLMISGYGLDRLATLTQS
jgi:hypothetical protein